MRIFSFLPSIIPALPLFTEPCMAIGVADMRVMGKVNSSFSGFEELQ
jgi:hypothetical protein